MLLGICNRLVDSQSVRILVLIIGPFRALRAFQTKEAIVGKLFAKHIKLEEAKQFLERARYDTSVVSTTQQSLF